MNFRNLWFVKKDERSSVSDEFSAFLCHRQAYKEHLVGQKHKKKETASKVGMAATLPKGGTALHCEVCDITCTGSDAYAAHIRGSKHQKVVKLHQKLGKPIPSNEPTVISNKHGGSGASKSATNGASASSGLFQIRTHLRGRFRGVSKCRVIIDRGVFLFV